MRKVLQFKCFQRTMRVFYVIEVFDKKKSQQFQNAFNIYASVNHNNMQSVTVIPCVKTHFT